MWQAKQARTETASVTGGTGKRSYVVGQTEIAARPLEPALYLV
ncbi:rRNA (cytidine-2'-O-)-methyltransferase, partial [Mesorhizobium sp. M8A.F.Ca.ET.059.01.1.1]